MVDRLHTADELACIYNDQLGDTCDRGAHKVQKKLYQVIRSKP